MKYHRKSIRLDGFDYANNGFYFVTICCQNRKNIFGKIDMEKKMILNDVGTMVEKIVFDYFDKNKFVELDEFIVMPDHIHMIIVINNKFNNVGAGLVPALNGNMETDVNINKTMDRDINMEMNMNINTRTDGEINTGVTTTNIMAGTNTNTRATTRVAPTLGIIIGELKSLTTNEYIKNVKTKNWPRFDKHLWQRNYFERIIRNEKEYFGYKKYIKENPVNYENKNPPKNGGF